MANDGNSRNMRMDLNLYLGPPSPPHLSSNLTDSNLTGFVEGLDLPYSPTYAPYIPISQTSEHAIQNDDSPVPYSLHSPTYSLASPIGLPSSPTRETSEPLVRDDDPYIPYSPSDDPNSPAYSLNWQPYYMPPYLPNPPSTHAQDGYESNLYSPSEPSLQVQEYFQHPEVNPLRRRSLFRRFRPAVLNRSNSNSGFQRSDSPVPVFIPRDTDRPRMETGENVIFLGQDSVLRGGRERSIEITETHEGNAVEIVAKHLKEEKKEQSSGASNFECNICLDMAKEPVVTSCGHLFCWPCLYQWLHLHSDTKQCPVCKGEVTESNITPIYGRGSSAIGVEKKSDEEGDLRLKVPPRPHGHRIESLRQRLHQPFSRRLEEQIRLWRRNVNDEIRNDNRVEEHREQSLEGLFDAVNRRIPARLRFGQLLQRENLEQELDLGQNLTSNPRIGDSHVSGLDGGSRSSSLVRSGHDVWRQLALNRLRRSDRLAAIRASISSMEGILARFERMGHERNDSGPSALVNPQNLEQLGGRDAQVPMPVADQASVSSTTAVIEGDAGVVNAFVEPSGAGSSSSLRRRRRNGDPSGSFDVDGGVHHARKRRRLN